MMVLNMFSVIPFLFCFKGDRGEIYSCCCSMDPKTCKAKLSVSIYLDTRFVELGIGL